MRRRSRHSETTQRARERVEQQALSVPRRPVDEPELPDDVTELHDSALMELLVLFTRWADYSGARLAMAFADERTAEAAHDLAKAKASVRDWGGTKDDRVTVAKARTETDDEVVTTRQAVLDAYAYRKLTEAVFDAHVRDAAVVSRELTRRVDREAPECRGHRWAGGQ